MVQTILQKNQSAWNKLENVMLQAKGVSQCYGYLAVENKGTVSYCALGFAGKMAGLSDENLSSQLLFPVKLDILSKYGFTESQRTKKRLCPEAACKCSGTLSYLITHLNDYHKLSIPQIGLRLKKIQNDKRSLPPFWKRIFYNFGYFDFG